MGAQTVPKLVPVSWSLSSVLRFMLADTWKLTSVLASCPSFTKCRPVFLPAWGTLRSESAVAWLETFKGRSQTENWEMFHPFLIGIWIMEKGQTLNLIFLHLFCKGHLCTNLQKDLTDSFCGILLLHREPLTGRNEVVAWCYICLLAWRRESSVR